MRRTCSLCIFQVLVFLSVPIPFVLLVQNAGLRGKALFAWRKATPLFLIIVFLGDSLNKCEQQSHADQKGSREKDENVHQHNSKNKQ